MELKTEPTGFPDRLTVGCAHAESEHPSTFTGPSPREAVPHRGTTPSVCPPKDGQVVWEADHSLQTRPSAVSPCPPGSASLRHRSAAWALAARSLPRVSTATDELGNK